MYFFQQNRERFVFSSEGVSLCLTALADEVSQFNFNLCSTSNLKFTNLRVSLQNNSIFRKSSLFYFFLNSASLHFNLMETVFFFVVHMGFSVWG